MPNLIRKLFGPYAAFKAGVKRDWNRRVGFLYSLLRKVQPGERRAIAIVVVALLIVVVTNSFLGTKTTLGADNAWTQTDWTGGADGGTGAVNPANNSGWNKYSSITNMSGSASPGNAVLTSSNLTATDDGTLTTTGTATGGGFGNGTNAGTTVTGGGGAASIGLTASAAAAANSFDGALAPAPGAINLGGGMLRNGSDDFIYALQGNDSNGFYKYSISTNTWTTLPVVPANVQQGGRMIRNGADDSIYVLQGNGLSHIGTGFYRYSISGNSWTTLALVPGGIDHGAAIIRNGADNEIYVLRGELSTSFYRYSISGDTWTTLAPTPGAVLYGGALLRNGGDDDIYALRGNSFTSFYRYSISGNSWTTLAAIPHGPNLGDSIIRNGAADDIYLLAGGNTNFFYRYSVSGNSWTTLAPTPLAIATGGGSLLRNGADDDIYALRGGTTNGFYRYSVSGNAWTTITSVPGTVQYGGMMMRNGSDNQIYILQGNTTTNLWRYNIVAGSTYPDTGTFTSAVIDTKGALSFGNLSWSQALPASTTLTFATRSGATAVPDGTWSAYSPELSTPAGSAITSPARRYIQYRGTFGTTNNTITPTLNDLTVAYAAFPASGNLVSSSFDSTLAGNTIQALTWTEDAALPTGTAATLSLRTASSSAGLTGAWTDFTNATSGCTKSTGTVTCPTSSIPSALKTGGDDRFFQYKVALSTAEGTVTPTVGSVVTTFGGVADLSLTMSSDTVLPKEGDTVVYSMTVANGGSEQATGVQVTDHLPAGLSFVSASASQGSYESGTGTWTIGTIANDTTKTLAITATVNAGTGGTTITNVAEIIASNTLDPDSTPNNGNPGEDDQASLTRTIGVHTTDRTTANALHPSRGKAGVPSTFGINFTLQNVLNGTTTVTFPSAFTVTGAPTAGTCASGTIDTFGFSAANHTFTAEKHGCTGAVSLTGGTVVNPSLIGTYEIRWENDDPGRAFIAITTEDQITITAAITPDMQFHVVASSTDCSHGGDGNSLDHIPSGDGGTVALGTLRPTAVGSSDAGAVNHICTFVSTNSSIGYALTVQSLNGQLKSTSFPADAIPITPQSSGAVTVEGGNPAYTMCLSTANAPNMDASTPTGSNLTATSPFNSGTCTGSTASQTAAKLTTAVQTIGSNSGKVLESSAQWLIKAAISAATTPHSDYADTLTFIATGTF